jgi:hypothetical protein
VVTCVGRWSDWRQAWTEQSKTNKGKDIFNVLSSYLETKGLTWENYIGICTDCAPSVVGSIRGFACLVKGENPDVTTRCFIHREVLV